MSSQVHYLPLTPGLFSILVLLFLGLLILIQLRILRYAYMRLGVGPGVALVLLFGSLIGSYFNVPITVLPGGPPVSSGEIVDFFGMRYVVPVRKELAVRTFFNHFATRQDMVQALAEKRLLNLREVLVNRTHEAGLSVLGDLDQVPAATS